ncbi:hypothetical protein [Acidovorax sp. Q11]
MRNALLALHLSFAALWIGCILTEALFERALLPKGDEARKILAGLHVRVDKIIEIPAIVVVLVSGSMLWLQASPTNRGFHLMLAAGATGIAANAYCVWLVFKRRRAAESEDWSRFEALDQKQHKFGAVVLVGVVLALAAGIWGRSAA